jgi:WD40 repeat protein
MKLVIALVMVLLLLVPSLGQEQQPRATLQVGNGTMAAAFSPDGRLLASSGKNGLAKVWEVATGKLLATLKAAACAMAVGQI